MESVLLVNPLTEEAGGSRWHAGGKHWESSDDEEWQALARWVDSTSIALDFGFYRDHVEPIFLNRRPGERPAAWCGHSTGGGKRLPRAVAPPGATTGTRSSRSATSNGCSGSWFPGAPMESVLLVNPLTEEAGGRRWHARRQALDDAGRRRVADPGRVGGGAGRPMTLGTLLQERLLPRER